MKFRRAASLIVALVAFFAGAESARPGDTAAPARPNIVFILLDNVGQEWFGCYGSDEGCTPNIEEFAAVVEECDECGVGGRYHGRSPPLQGDSILGPRSPEQVRFFNRSCIAGIFLPSGVRM